MVYQSVRGLKMIEGTREGSLDPVKSSAQLIPLPVCEMNYSEYEGCICLLDTTFLPYLLYHGFLRIEISDRQKL